MPQRILSVRQEEINAVQNTCASLIVDDREERIRVPRLPVSTVGPYGARPSCFQRQQGFVYLPTPLMTAQIAKVWELCFVSRHYLSTNQTRCRVPRPNNVAYWRVWVFRGLT